MTASRYPLEVLEFAKVRDLLGRFLISPLGRAHLDGLVPFDSPEKMERALAQAKDMHAWLQAGGRLPLGPLSDLRPRLEMVAKGSRRLQAADLADLLKLLRSTGRMRRVLSDLPEYPALQALGERLPDLSALYARLEAMVDERGELQNSASQKLANLRAEIHSLRQSIEALMQRLLEEPSIRRNLQSPQVSWRHGRPVLQIKPEGQRSVRGIFHDRSQSGQTVFVEPQAAVEPVNRLASLQADESAEIQRLLAELLREILASKSDVYRALAGLAWVDYTQARARLVSELGFSIPEQSVPGRFHLREARHPLLLRDLWEGKRELVEVLAEVVPLDLDLGNPYTMVVVTGPNTGGKTVALKTVGLLCLMAQAGMPVPVAEGTALPWVDGIFADIGDEQAIEQSLSTFSSHLARIHDALALAGSGSLVLLDELGAGTDPEEGGALGYSILEALHKKRVPCLASTHLGRLKDFAYQHEGVENGAMSFDAESLDPLYCLELGLPGHSNALHIALRVGIAEELVARAREILGQRDQSLEDMIGRVQATRQAAEKHRREAEQTRLLARSEAKELEGRKEEVERKEGWLREEAEHFVDEELRAARDMLREPLGQFCNAPRPYGEKASSLIKLLDELLSGSSLGRRRESYLETVKKGHMVYVPRYRRRCTVLKIDRKRRQLSLEMGGLRVEVPYEDVSWLQPLDS
jgi:DNA mismatch repair protein MutS2